LVQALGQYSFIRDHVRIFLQGIEKFCVQNCSWNCLLFKLLGLQFFLLNRIKRYWNMFIANINMAIEYLCWFSARGKL